MTDHRRRSQQLFERLAALGPDDPARPGVRDELVALHAGLAYAQARRHARRGEPADDLEQVAMVGLLKAVDRYEPGRGLAFSTFAVPTIRGEIRRHFRDTAWALHVPRGLRELAVQIPPVVERLTTDLRRSPRPSEVATALGVPVERVVEALEAAEAFSTVPLDVPAADGRPLTETVGRLDDAFDRVQERESLRPLVEALPERERTILRLRFFEEMTQSQIAAEVGLSQMHVSRLLARALASLREGLVTTGAS